MNWRCVVVLPFLMLGGCRAAGELLHGPEATDPLDGYRGSLSQAGINTEMDWGPKQNLLLSEYKTLKEAHVLLERRLDELVAENQNLKSQLGNESSSLQQAKALHAQAEAETEMLRQRVRDREAQILSLSIEKAKLEQAALLGRIEALQQSLREDMTAPVEAAGSPPRER